MSKVQTRAQPAPRPSAPATLIAIPILSILAGLLVHLFAVHLPPKNGLLPRFNKDISQLAAEIQMSDAWPAFLRARSDPNVRSATKVLLVLLAFFRDMLSTQFAKGILWLLAVASMPLILHILLESTKAGRHPLLSPLNIFIVASLGQVFCLGGATNLISVPTHAYVRYLQIVRANDALNASKKNDDKTISPLTLDQVVHPTPSAGFWKTNVACLLSGLAIITIGLSIHVSPAKYPQEWIASNIAFQFFPVFFLPLLLPGLAAAAKLAPAPKPGSIVIPRLHSAQLYQITSLITVPLWWFGIYLTSTPLRKKVNAMFSVIKGIGGYLSAIRFIRQQGIKIAINVAFPLSHGEWLLIWDLVGILIALYSIVWIDLVADDWAYRLFSSKVAGYKRPHEKRYLIEDVIIGLPSALVLGPGFAGARYFQRREVMAEKARLLGE
ncbi:unnamed protein product [Tilletia laevis]|uniref:Uncharacterized protein n=2 Tax=Tilletia TaxID=13289 RepID=A0A177U8V8_9BASI|nr:hypothetical protein CF336_g6070 [Tilletia laevis]KAE8256468.1 hypothetical protein A4X03_0g5376 [Tilletia caries]CAD6971351.1 unnamed protein product [Tilletia controversa]KAE8194546.1 hypothetical protein CF335_g5323 [Tilletia laevis]CAD6886458.1 unnamed protein product [Tilletia caries]